MHGKKEGEEFDRIGDLTFSPEGKRFAYVGKKGPDYWVILDGARKGPYQSADSLAFSPDGKRFAYVAAKNDRFFVVVGKKEGKKHDAVGSLCFRPDGKSVAYEAYDCMVCVQCGTDHNAQMFTEIAREVPSLMEASTELHAELCELEPRPKRVEALTREIARLAKSIRQSAVSK